MGLTCPATALRSLAFRHGTAPANCYRKRRHVDSTGCLRISGFLLLLLPFSLSEATPVPRGIPELCCVKDRGNSIFLDEASSNK